LLYVLSIPGELTLYCKLGDCWLPLGTLAGGGGDVGLRLVNIAPAPQVQSNSSLDRATCSRDSGYLKLIEGEGNPVRW
jgi:hypothetical protein